MISLRAATASIGVLLLLTGCGPGDTPTDSAATATMAPTETVTPTAEPAPLDEPPAVAGLVLSPEGLGPLVIGQAPPSSDPRSDMVVNSPTVCQWAVDQGYRDSADMWVANYEPALGGEDPSPFGVHVSGGVLQVISANDDAIMTATGIHLGSSASDVAAAYPSAVQLDEYEFGDTHVYKIEGTAGDLYIDVLKAESAELYPEYGGEVVVRLNVFAIGSPFAPFNSGFGLGYCITS